MDSRAQRLSAPSPAEGDAGRADDADFDDLYGRYATRALKLAGLLCGHREQAEDAVADAFLRVLPKWRSSTIEEFWPYLRTAVVNELRGGHRRAATAVRWRHRTHQPASVAEADSRVVERARVAAALRKLPDRQRTAVVLRYFEDLSEQETADIMGCAVGTVKSTTARGAAGLRALLAEEEDR